MEEINVIDNFLPIDLFNRMQQKMMSVNFPWYYLDYITTKKIDENNKENFQFIHMFYSSNAPNSEFFPMIYPVMNELDIAALLRVKANLTTKTTNHIKREFHVDTKYNNKTSILYLNTNNGYTLFENGDKILSVENRLVTFDAQTRHTGVSCTDESVRIVLNFNYYN